MNVKKLAIIGTIALVVIGCVMAAGCTSSIPSVETTVSGVSINTLNTGVSGLIFDISVDDFESAGFVPGDIVTVTFADGNQETLVPYLKGSFFYLVNLTSINEITDSLLILHYRNNGTEMVPPAYEGEKVIITRQYATGAALLQKILGPLNYSNDRNNYPSDEVFANFRVVDCGNLKENLIYRGASPLNNIKGRASTADTLLEKAGIKTDFNLSDTEELLILNMSAEDFKSPYAASLYENGNGILVRIGLDYFNDETKRKVADGLIQMSEKEGPFYIHCLEGKDRAGFVCLLLEALGDATIDEMADDYMKSYENYYLLSKNSIEYNLIKALKFDDVVSPLTKNNTLTLKEGAKQYLREGGMTDEQIDRLVTMLTS